MKNITLTNDDFNVILSKNKKINLNHFLTWYESLCPSYKFIKDKKKLFQKNSKNIYYATGLKSITIGEDITWEKIYFINHYDFLSDLIEVLDSKKIDYWQNYLYHILSLPTIPLFNAYEIICHSIENKDFLTFNLEKIESLFEVSISLVILPKNIEFVERYLNVFKYIIANNTFNMNWSLVQLSRMVDGLPAYKLDFQLKDIFNNQRVLDLEIEEEQVSKKIVPFIKKQSTYSRVVGTGFHFSIDTRLISLKVNNDLEMSQAQLIYQLNVLSNFINTIREEQKIFWFIDSQFKANNLFEIDAFPKGNEALVFIEKMIEECINDVFTESELEIFLNENYLEQITPISSNIKNQVINKF